MLAMLALMAPFARILAAVLPMVFHLASGTSVVQNAPRWVATLAATHTSTPAPRANPASAADPGEVPAGAPEPRANPAASAADPGEEPAAPPAPGASPRQPDPDEPASEAEQDRARGESLPGSGTPSVSFGRSVIEVPEGRSHDEDLVCIGGTVIVRGEVRGEVVVVTGVLEVSGTIHGDVTAIGSNVKLLPGARIRGEFVNVAGTLERAENVSIEDHFRSIEIPAIGNLASGRGVFRYLMILNFWITVLGTAMRFLGVLVVAAVAAPRLETSLLPPRPSWALAFFLGLIVNAAVWVLWSMLMFGCITIPIAAALWVALNVAQWMGLAALYLHMGRRIGVSVFGRTPSYFGAILIGFGLFALVGFVPIFGWVVNGIMSRTGLGLMLLTRFGARGQVTAPVSPPVPHPA